MKRLFKALAMILLLCSFVFTPPTALMTTYAEGNGGETPYTKLFNVRYDIDLARSRQWDKISVAVLEEGTDNYIGGYEVQFRELLYDYFAEKLTLGKSTRVTTRADGEAYVPIDLMDLESPAFFMMEVVSERPDYEIIMEPKFYGVIAPRGNGAEDWELYIDEIEDKIGDKINFFYEDQMPIRVVFKAAKKGVDGNPSDNPPPDDPRLGNPPIGPPSGGSGSDKPGSDGRVQGETRYETAVEISRRGWETSDKVIVIRGDLFVEGLISPVLGHKEDAPILFTLPEKLHEVTREEIKRLMAKKVFIIGGPKAVSERAEKELRDMGLEVERLGGKDRYETAAIVANRAGIKDTVMIANGEEYWASLSVAPYAARNGYPILLVNKDIPPAVKNVLSKANKSIVIGSENFVSGLIFSELKNPVRLEGKDQYEILGSVIEYGYSENLHSVYVSTGMDFADAAAGSVWAAKEGKAIIFVRKDNIPEVVRRIIVSKGMKDFVVIGGPAAIADSVLEYLKTLASQPAEPRKTP